MNLMNQVKLAVGIDPAYDIIFNTMDETRKARDIFLAAVKQAAAYGDVKQEDIVSYGLSEVWHAAKQYYAQHPEELHKCIVR
ncbi:MAG: hypothetical protein Q4D42_10685 [Eubacteriales bacterium]|nr:hypothetical protein [Eubacteriales bacterium]